MTPELSREPTSPQMKSMLSNKSFASVDGDLYKPSGQFFCLVSQFRRECVKQSRLETSVVNFTNSRRLQVGG